MRVRLTLTVAVTVTLMAATACGDESPAAVTATTSQPEATSSTGIVTTMATTSPTTTAPIEPTVTWRETLALGSSVAVRHLAVSSGVFMALTEADFRRPGDVPMAAYLSGDGASWTGVDLPSDLFTDAILFELAGGPAGFIGLGAVIDESGGLAAQYVWTSPNGESWSRSELADPGLPEASSPFVITATNPESVAAGQDGFVVAGSTRRFLDNEAIVTAYQPDFEWPEFAYMATRALDDGDVELTIGGDNDDLVVRFSELGIEPTDFPTGDVESDWITVLMGSHLWTSLDGINWIETPGPEISSGIGNSIQIDATALGMYAHSMDYGTGALQSWHSTDALDWVDVSLPGTPVLDWSGGLYAFDSGGDLWTSQDGRSWSESEGPTAAADSRDLMPTATTPDSAIVVAGVRPDGSWQDATVPESWVAVSTDGATWYEATGVEAFGMPIWPEAIAGSGDRIVIGLVGDARGSVPATYLWLGTVADN